MYNEREYAQIGLKLKNPAPKYPAHSMSCSIHNNNWDKHKITTYKD